MNAKEMFEADGVSLVVDTNEYIDIYELWDGIPCGAPLLRFNKETKWMEIHELMDAFNPNTILCIHQQMKELGWIE